MIKPTVISKTDIMPHACIAADHRLISWARTKRSDDTVFAIMSLQEALAAHAHPVLYVIVIKTDL